VAQSTGHDARQTQTLFVVVAVVPFQCIRISLRKSVVNRTSSENNYYIQLRFMRSSTLPRVLADQWQLVDYYGLVCRHHFLFCLSGFWTIYTFCSWSTFYTILYSYAIYVYTIYIILYTR